MLCVDMFKFVYFDIYNLTDNKLFLYYFMLCVLVLLFELILVSYRVN